MRLQKLYEVFAPGTEQHEAPKKADAIANLVQCLDDRISLSGLVIREAKDDRERALEVLRRHYQGKGNWGSLGLSRCTHLTTWIMLYGLRMRRQRCEPQKK
jgi:hypothetical protein